jgi:hypothetical protein
MSHSVFSRTFAILATAAAMLAAVGCNDSLAQKDVQPPAQREERKASKDIAIDFEKAEVGKAPHGFTAALTGGGGDVSWVIVNDPSSSAGAKALAQSSKDKTNKRYPVCVYDDFAAKDVDVSVQFKAISGEVDQAAGIVWRYRDRDNYYVVRANALENNVVLYKTQNGVRTDLKLKAKDSGYGVKADVPKDKWSTLKVSAAGNSFIVYLNDKALFEVVDDTFTEAGKVGVWTKADSVTHFDDLRIRGFDRP